MDPALWYFIWATLAVLVAALAWTTNFLTLPGNWVVVALAVGLALLYPEDRGDTYGLHWGLVAANALVAGLGEVIEFAAGAVGAARQGASRRSVALSVVGAIAGSAFGLTLGLPVPILGPLIGALAGGALGAFGGTLVGEVWAGRAHAERMRASWGALFGRLAGTAGKLATGAVQVVLLAYDVYF